MGTDTPARLPDTASPIGSWRLTDPATDPSSKSSLYFFGGRRRQSIERAVMAFSIHAGSLLDSAPPIASTTAALL